MTKPTGKPRGRPKAQPAPKPAKAAKPATAKPAAKAKGVGLAISDATILRYYDQADSAKREFGRIKITLDSANGVYRSVLKAAQKEGGPELKLALMWRLAQVGKDVKDIDRHTAWCNRIARLTNLPIGTQLGLFDDGTTVASAADKAAVPRETIAEAANTAWGNSGVPPRNGAYTTSELTEAWRAGEKAAGAGEKRTACPHEFGTPLSDRWYQGFDEEEKRLFVAPAPAVTGETEEITQ